MADDLTLAGKKLFSCMMLVYMSILGCFDKT